MNTMAMFCFCLITAPVAAQSVLLVGPGQPYADIQSAIQAAVPNDVVLIAAGTYAPFTLDKPITLRTAVPGAAVFVDASQWVAVALPNTGRALIDGLHFLGHVGVSAPSGASTGGALSLVDVTVESGTTVTDADLALTNCTMVGPATINLGYPGIELFGTAHLSTTGSTIHGAHTSSFLLGGAAVDVADQAQAHLSSCVLLGGESLSHFSALGAPGLNTRMQGRAWLVDCDVSGSLAAGIPPQSAIRNVSTEPVLIERCTLTAGQFAPVTIGVVQSHLLLGIATPNTVVSPGGVVQVDYHTQPGLFVASHVGFTIQAAASHPLLAEPEWGMFGSSLFLGFLTPDPQGVASLVVPVPNLPGLAHLPLWFSGWTAVGLPVEVAPLANVILR